MSDKKIIFAALSIVIILLLFYFVTFWGADVSINSSDWGAFGNYAAICVSVLSIAFIYVTYREQRNTNEISRTEQHIDVMLKTMIILCENKHLQLESTYRQLSKHFNEPFNRVSKYEYDEIVNVCRYYYLAISEDNINSLKSVIQYTHLCIGFIIHDKLLSQENKQSTLTELICIIPVSIRLILFFWLIQNSRKELKEFYSYGVFSLNDTSYRFLEDVISYVCTTKCPPDKVVHKVNVDDIIYEDYPKELFSETDLRLNSKDFK